MEGIDSQISIISYQIAWFTGYHMRCADQSYCLYIDFTVFKSLDNSWGTNEVAMVLFFNLAKPPCHQQGIENEVDNLVFRPSLWWTVDADGI